MVLPMPEPGRQLPRLLRRVVACSVFSLGVTSVAQQPAPTTPPSNPQPAAQQPVAPAQDPASQPQPAQQPQQAAPPQPAAQPASAAPLTTSSSSIDIPEINEDEVRQQLQGKTFFLRGGYLDNTLHFDDHGTLDGSSPQASYTLSLVEITRVRLDKRHLELEGERYGLHFLGALPSEDQSQAYDKVRLTSKKKPLRITIDREDVVKPRKEKEPKGQPAIVPAKPPATGANPAPPGTSAQPRLLAPPPEIGRHGVTETTSQDQANHALRQAIDHVFSPGIDDKMISTLPQYWKLYYKSVANKQEFRPDDPSVLRENQVDHKAKLVSVFEPPSNEYAQTNGVAGMALYRVVVNPDGTPGEIAVDRPIGFGLDENAVAEIRKARFEPAMKDGKPVPVLLDLVVQFRIFSKRTAAVANASSRPAGPEAPVLPGPYSVNLPKPQQPGQDQTQQQPQPQQ